LTLVTILDLSLLLVDHFIQIYSDIGLQDIPDGSAVPDSTMNLPLWINRFLLPAGAAPQNSL
jgi:hypothetical protein